MHLKQRTTNNATPIVNEALKETDEVSVPKSDYAQDRWQQRQYALGNCIICGQPRGDSSYKRLCRRHGAMQRLRQRKHGNHRPWTKKRGGRVPIDVPVIDQEHVDRVFPPPPPKRPYFDRSDARRDRKY